MHIGYRARHGAPRERGRKALTVTAAGAVFAIAAGGTAFADNLQSDLNSALTGQQKLVDLGTVAASTAKTQSVDLWVAETSGAQNNPTYPLDVSGGSTSASDVTATFDGVTIQGAGAANEQTGTISFTTPAATTTEHAYKVLVAFSGNSAVNESPANVEIDFKVAAADTNPCDSVATPAAPTFSNGGSTVWYNTAQTPSATSTNDDGTYTYTYSVDSGSFAAASELTEGQYSVVARATTATCSKTADSTAQAFNIDTTAPTSTVSGITEGAVYAVAPGTCDSDDNLSGVATGGTLSGATTTPGPQTVSCNGAVDNASNTQTVPSSDVHYTLAPLGSFNSNFDGSAVLKVKPNQAIPLKWTFSDGTTNYALLNGATLASVSSTRCTVQDGTDGTEVATEVAAGASGLQLLPDNSYQMNWKATSTTGCRALTATMTLAGGGTVTRSVLVNISK